MKKLFIVALAYASLTSQAATLIIKLNAQSESYYSQNGKDTFIKEYSNLSAQKRITVIEAGKEFQSEENIPVTRDQSKGLKSITVLKNDIVQLVDKQVDEQGYSSNIDAKVKAKLNKKGIFGKLTGLSISSNDLEALYIKDFERIGLDLLKNLNINTEEISLSSTVQLSDMNCEIQGGGMECLEKFELVIKVSDE